MKCNKKITSENIKTITFKKEKDNYYVVFVYGIEEKKVKENNNFISIDLGYSQLITAFSNKIDNFSILNERQTI